MGCQNARFGTAGFKLGRMAEKERSFDTPIWDQRAKLLGMNIICRLKYTGY